MYLCTLKTIGMTGQKTPTALGTEKIGKLLMQYAIPAIIAMTASSLYNMVDSIFIGHGVGPMAISGLALTFPLMNLAAAFGSLVGVGAATLISVKLGQKDYDTAQRVLGNVLVLNIIIGLAFTILTLIFLDPILYFFGGSDETVGYARDYMKVILYGNVITHIYLGLNAVLRSAGHPQKAMVATIATVVINTILDPLFIYGFGWGIQGAAIATITAQVIALAWQTCSTSNFFVSSGRAARSTALTDCAPSEPPIIIKTGLPPSKPASFSPRARSPEKICARSGVPVWTPFGASSFAHSGNVVQMDFANGLHSLFASPGVISLSCITTGTPQMAAPKTTGTLTKPPLEKTTSGFSLPMIPMLWNAPAMTRKGSVKFCQSK